LKKVNPIQGRVNLPHQILSKGELKMQITLTVGEQEYDAIQAALAYYQGISLVEAHRIAAKRTGASLTVNGISRLRTELERQHDYEQREEKDLAHAVAVGREYAGIPMPPVPAPATPVAAREDGENLNASNDQGEFGGEA
jgi:hypothetical protein